MKLERLLVDPDALDQSLLAELLEPYLSLEKNTGAMRFKEAWHRLDARRRIVAYLLGCKAGRALALRKGDGATPKDIEDETGIKGGTVRPLLKALLDERVVAKDSDGNYFIPNHGLELAKRMLQSEKGPDRGAGQRGGGSRG